MNTYPPSKHCPRRPIQFWPQPRPLPAGARSYEWPYLRHRPCDLEPFRERLVPCEALLQSQCDFGTRVGRYLPSFSFPRLPLEAEGSIRMTVTVRSYFLAIEHQ